MFTLSRVIFIPFNGNCDESNKRSPSTAVETVRSVIRNFSYCAFFAFFFIFHCSVVWLYWNMARDQVVLTWRQGGKRYVRYNKRSSELSSGLYCRVEWLSTDVSEVRTASIIRDDEDSSEHHTRRRENLKSHITKEIFMFSVWRHYRYTNLFWKSLVTC
jgi:hypothetical protein